jgi:pantoate--beta-alanine ligase
MRVIHTIDDLRACRDGLPAGRRLALVPTMGALHAGHLDHVHRALRVADEVIVSIFVNPTQFAPHEDFNRYPRPFDVDVSMCAEAGAAAVFAPEPQSIYPPGGPDACLNVPSLATILEGAARPDHFQGVCRVVMKLLQLTRPDVVTFGRKDYQQLRVVEAMITDLFVPVSILEVPTVREPDGLAMSSRNRYLTDTQRPHALGLNKALRQVEAMIHAGEADPQVLEAAMRQTLVAHDLNPDYAVVRHPRTLQPLEHVDPALTHGVVALIAARLGQVRLIDNLLIER